MKDELIIDSRPKSNISEDIRTIRTNLQFTSSDNASQVLLVTSSIQGDGKSFISSNLAAAFAQTGESVLIIDGDLRLGRINKIFNLSNEKGFSNLLICDDEIDFSQYIKKTKIQNLYVITRGSVPPNPSELLNSSNYESILKVLRKNFDRIIIDGVPVNGLSDSLIMASHVDRVILVCSCNHTNIDELNEAKKALEKVDANIAGVVVNRTPQTKRGKYSNYYE